METETQKIKSQEVTRIEKIAVKYGIVFMILALVFRVFSPIGFVLAVLSLLGCSFYLLYRAVFRWFWKYKERGKP